MRFSPQVFGTLVRFSSHWLWNIMWNIMWLSKMWGESATRKASKTAFQTWNTTLTGFWCYFKLLFTNLNCSLSVGKLNKWFHPDGLWMKLALNLIPSRSQQRRLNMRCLIWILLRFSLFSQHRNTNMRPKRALSSKNGLTRLTHAKSREVNLKNDLLTEKRAFNSIV